ncbi:translational GTPase TypA [Enterobacteriaceae endosymbiont of Donacia bicoloricornis]|uniref:translational GTPase TypA n=1 Tax=Enterobacteriaceae endosymbiont of Donacia bicoloricornis TaxID=2675772 RepID=UPI001448BDD3|nr:translational GTPase TypA [Enterobacteriaceae endosymbiont of Donacia bicoloricornis]QJC37892.1 translational GTPase TypA [Enterobacteriaceae endosymbiont of Donacia bicoloricornis]
MKKIRNIAIVAHIDHGKTTLIDKLLQGSDNFKTTPVENNINRIMDSNELEKEKGITIFSKNTSIFWKNYKINIIDTPGHADFGAEVERILSMVDSVLLLVDAIEGPMPQTRFVTSKAFSYNLKPIVIINKIDRKFIRPDWVINKIFDLFIDLDASDEQLDFPIVYTSALKGTSGYNINKIQQNMDVVYKTIIKHVPSPKGDINHPFQMQISQIEYNNYVGNICIGLIKEGQIKKNQYVTIIKKNKKFKKVKILHIIFNIGLKPIYSDIARFGDIVGIAGSGFEDISISDTICDVNYHIPLPILKIEKPKIGMLFHVNDSPFSGMEGEHVTSNKIFNRIKKFCLNDVALKITKTKNNNTFYVSGRGELHLVILIENMRKEGFELSVSKPQIISKIKNGKELEPFEILTLDFNQNKKGKIIQLINHRKAIINNIILNKNNRIKIEAIISSKGLIGFRSKFINLTSGNGIMNSFLSHYDINRYNIITDRNYGVLISNKEGYAVAFSLYNLQSRGKLLINPGEKVYEGQIIGIHNKFNDLVVNCLINKKLTNMRAAGNDNPINLISVKKMSLEEAIDFINNDELVEITPKTIRIRKKYLKKSQRKLKNYKNIKK